MSQRILTGTLFTLAIIAFMLPGFWWPAVPLVMLLIVGLLGQWELERALHQRQLKLPLVSSRLGIGLFLLPLLAAWSALQKPLGLAQPASWPVVTLLAGLLLLTGLIVWSTLTGISILIRGGPPALPRLVVTIVQQFYLVLPLGSGVILLYFIPRGWFWLVLALGSTWVSDVLAFFVGVALGRHKIVPQISPKKSVEGSLGGLFGGILAAAVMMPFVFELDFSTYFKQPLLLVATVLIGSLLSTASQFGDWMASGIKRWCDVKDFGHWLPGHGGILDRFDGILFTLPLTGLLAFVISLR